MDNKKNDKYYIDKVIEKKEQGRLFLPFFYLL